MATRRPNARDRFKKKISKMSPKKFGHLIPETVYEIILFLIEHQDYSRLTIDDIAEIANSHLDDFSTTEKFDLLMGLMEGEGEISKISFLNHLELNRTLFNYSIERLIVKCHDSGEITEENEWREYSSVVNSLYYADLADGEKIQHFYHFFIFSECIRLRLQKTLESKIDFE